MSSPSSPSRRERLALVRVYVVATPAAHGPAWRDALEAALSTGLVGMVQLREKSIDDDAYLTRARDVRSLCAEHDALFLVNDRVHLVAAAAADGVHVGQADMPPEEARAAIGDHRLLGLSTHDTDEVAGARARGADHVGLGPCFPTATKALDRTPGGPDLVRDAMARAGDLPVFPIGGITADDIAVLAAAGARRAAVGAGILEAPDPAEAVRRIHTALSAVP